MDLGLTPEQEMLRQTAREFLERECPSELVRAMEKDERGYSPELWKKMADLGWMGLPFPEAYGGGGGSFLDLTVLLEEMGRALLPGPFFPTVVLGGLTLLSDGSEAQKKRWLPSLRRGETFLTAGLTEPDGRYEASSVSLWAEPVGGEFALRGSKFFVPDAHVAQALILVARTQKQADPTQGISLFLLETPVPGLKLQALKTLALDKQFEVVLDQVWVSKENLIGPQDQGWPRVERILERAAVAQCAEVVGMAQKALEMTVEYAKIRVQFGRPIGSFQAIQHMCADMLVNLDSSKLLTYQAAWRIGEGLPAAKEAAMAKAWTSEACRQITADAHQIHGGIAFMVEHDLQLYFRRVKAAEALFGSPEFYHEWICREMNL